MTGNPAPGFVKHPLHRVDLDGGGNKAVVALGGETIARTEDAIVLRETGYPPRTYVPAGDVDMTRMTATSHATHCPFKGDARYWTVRAGGRTVANGAWAYETPYDEMARLAGRIAFYDEEIEVRTG